MALNVAAAMSQLAAELDPLISRYVTDDPSRIAGAPCVLVDLPRFNGDGGTLCGEDLWEFRLIAIGQPGMRAELQPLSDLLQDLLEACDQVALTVASVQPATWTPFNVPLEAEESMAYIVTVERYVS
jgi:hypothetical protein